MIDMNINKIINNFKENLEKKYSCAKSEDIGTVDVALVIRCKYCPKAHKYNEYYIWCNVFKDIMLKDGFCSRSFKYSKKIKERINKYE